MQINCVFIPVERKLMRVTRTLPSLITCIMALMAIFINPYLAGAVGETEPDWITGEPAVRSRGTRHEECKTERHFISAVAGRRYLGLATVNMPTEQDLCVYRSENFSYAQYTRFYYTASLYPEYGATLERGLAIMVAGSVIMVPSLSIGQAYSASEFYLGYTTKFLQVSGRKSTFGLYNNFTQHLIYDGGTGTYSLDGRPDFSVYDEGGEPAVVEGLGMSDNKRYISFAVEGAGLMVADLNNSQVIKLTDRYQYDYQYPHRSALTSVNNSGTLAVLSGDNMETEVYLRSQGCSELVGGGVVAMISHMTAPCPYRNISPFLNNYFAGIDGTGANRISYVQLRGDGSLIDASNYRSEATIFAPNYDPSRLQYLALGDSYASGEGDLTEDYLPQTNIYGDYRLGIPREMCHVSRGSYPLLIAKDMGLSHGSSMQSVACSGAVVPDVLSTEFAQQAYVNPLYEGQQTQRMTGDGSRLHGLSNISELQQQARTHYVPGRIQQIEYVRATQPKVMTIMIGGNDLGFGDIMASCARSLRLTSIDQTCSDLLPEGQLANTQKIYSFYPRLREMYKAIKDQYIMPNPRIFVIGYPKFFDGSAYCADMFGVYTQTEQRVIGELIDYANATIRQAANDEGLTYIDISSALTGREMCGKSNAMTTADDLLIKGIYTEYMKYKDAADANIRAYGSVSGSIVNQSPGFTTVYLSLRIADVVDRVGYSPSTAIYGTMQQLAHPNKTGHLAIVQLISSGLGRDLLFSDACNTTVLCAGTPPLGHAPDPAPYVSGVSLSDAQEKIVLNGSGIMSVGARIDSAASNTVLPTLRRMARNVTAGVSREYLNIMDVKLSSPLRLTIRSTPVDLGLLHFNASNGRYEVQFDVPNVSLGYHTLHIEGRTTDGMVIDIERKVFVEGPDNDIDGDGVQDSTDTCAFGEPSERDADNDGVDDSCDLSVTVSPTVGQVSTFNKPKDNPIVQQVSTTPRVATEQS
jgi:lysophospholipase L1-like esterase